MTFEDDLARLDAIAAELRQDAIPLDRALGLFEEGIECLRRASATLGRAETRVSQLVEQSDGAFTLRPFHE
jgi:exodeoxyribonuclease VII small subunit